MQEEHPDVQEQVTGESLGVELAIALVGVVKALFGILGGLLIVVVGIVLGSQQKD